MGVAGDIFIKAQNISGGVYVIAIKSYTFYYKGFNYYSINIKTAHNNFVNNIIPLYVGMTKKNGIARMLKSKEKVIKDLGIKNKDLIFGFFVSEHHKKEKEFILELDPVLNIYLKRKNS